MCLDLLYLFSLSSKMLASVLFIGFAILSLGLVPIAMYLFWLSNHWSRKGVPSYGNVFTGVMQRVFLARKCAGECLRDIYHQTKHLKYYGTFIFGQPVIVLQDTEIIKTVMLKDYANYASHGTYYDKEHDPLSAHLFNLAGKDWTFMRAKLNPTFTAAKVKYMFNTIQDCVSKFHDAVDEARDTENNRVSLRELLARLGTDIIVSVAFGIESNSVRKSDSVFRKLGKAYFSPRWALCMRYLLRSNFKLTKLLRMRYAGHGVTQFFMRTVSKMVKYREENNVTRKDFLDLLINLKNDDTKSGDEFFDRKITVEDIAAQSFIFFIAGFETCSATIGFALYEIARHPDIQKKVQEECDQVLEACGGKVTFEAIQSMDYTYRVLQETMRLYPVTSILPRSVTKSCKLPTTDLFLEKDTIVWIPLLALHTDEDNFSDAQNFDPDRFTEENKGAIPSYAYMPFGDGPRYCIGMRFAVVQMKATILEVMSRYDLEPADTTTEVELHPSTLVTAPKNDLRLKIIARVERSSMY